MASGLSSASVEEHGDGTPQMIMQSNESGEDKLHKLRCASSYRELHKRTQGGIIISSLNSLHCRFKGKVRVNIYFRSWVMSFGINGCDWDKSDSREWLRANKNVPCAKTTLCQLKNCWVSLCISHKKFCLLGDKSVTPAAQFGLTPPIHKLCYIEKPENNNNNNHLITRTFNFWLNYLIVVEWNHWIAVCNIV